VDVEREARDLTVHELTLERIQDPRAEHAIRMVARVSKGTYIRTLAEDIGEALGCGAHLISLRRVATGHYGVDQCVTLPALEAMNEQERLACLLPVDSLLPQHTAVTLDADNAGRFLSGLRRRGVWNDNEQVAVYGTDPPALLGTGHVKAGELIPGRLLSPPEIQQILETTT
jgi:tRNA pseudouridine55 synthase